MFHYFSYSNSNCKDSELTDNDVTSDCENSDVIKEIYKEGNDKADPYHCFVDTGCPKTVAGQPWMDSYVESLGNKEYVIKRRREEDFFKFGPSDVYKSDMSHEISVEIGSMITTIKVSVVQADVPLLLGTDYQEKWGIIMDIAKKELHIKKSNETFKISSVKNLNKC